MGKRKSRAKPEVKKRDDKVPTIFSCPYCNHEASVDCQLDRVRCVGVVSCRICNEEYRTQINNLTDPIDVYSEWIDEAERVNAPTEES